MPEVKFLLGADMPRSSADIIRTLGFEMEDVRDINMGSAKDREMIPISAKCLGIQSIPEPLFLDCRIYSQQKK